MSSVLELVGQMCHILRAHFTAIARYAEPEKQLQLSIYRE